MQVERMRSRVTTWKTLTLFAASLLVAACTQAKSPPTSADLKLAAAEALIDAFYSFDPDPLRAALADAPASQPEILYYQGWAEGGNYKVIDRKPCRFDKPDEVSCSIKVEDDLIGALGTGYDVTDTFHLTFKDGRIVKVATSSDDPPEFDRARKWLEREHPEILDGPCRGFFDGGPTPGDCVRAVVAGFGEWRARSGRGDPQR